MDIGLKLQAILGLAVFIGIAWLASENRSAFPRRTVIAGVALQFILAVLLLTLPPMRAFFEWLNGGVAALGAATEQGTGFVFGYLGGADLPYEVQDGAGTPYVFALRALPLIFVIGALTSLLTYWRVLPLIIKGMSAVLSRTLKVGGAVGLAAGANVFVGMVEAPMFIRDYIDRLSRSELFMVMSLGMATIAGSVLVLFAQILEGILPNAVGHLLTASLINLPSAIVMSAVMVPEMSNTATRADQDPLIDYSGPMDAIVQGTMAAGRVFLSVVVMLIVFVALVALANSILAVFPDVGGGPLTLQRMLGWIMAPVCWLMGIPWEDARVAGGLMGIKTVLNELLAFIEMAGLEDGALSQRSQTIMSYALCGFASFSSLGILMGGLSSMAPNRRQDIVDLGIRSILAGTLATCSTAAVASLFIT